jgi:seryl-tRNA synthetase
MVLDIDLFREEKGGNVEYLREQQRKRFKDPAIVDRVVDCDTRWRQHRYNADQWNRLSNAVSKAVGERMKVWCGQCVCVSARMRTE